MSKVFDVFISYRRSDGEDLAKLLEDYLTKKGVRVFLDREELEPGKKFPKQLHGALIAAPHYVLIGSEDALTFREGEDWVRTELSIALEYAEKDSERRLTVLLPPDVDLSGPHPQEVEKALTYHAVDMKNYNTEEKAFRAIFNMVSGATKVNLWHAAHKWFENSKRPGGRFERLHIDESIMPKACETERRGELPIMVSVDKTDGKSVSLMDAIKKTEGHLFLIGEGGIGKTTSLMKIMEDAYADKSDGGKVCAAQYDPKAPVTIFIDLSFARVDNGTVDEIGASTFIRRSIYKQLRERNVPDSGVYPGAKEANRAFVVDYDLAVNPIDDVLKNCTTDSPGYLLLLDGLNEVSTATISGTNDTVLDLIRAEIKTLLDYPNVRIILTSRTDDVCASYGVVKKLYLSGIDEENIRAFIEKQPCTTKEKLDKALSDDKLRETLRIPLFLTMYAKLKNRDVCTRGEILRCFFHERRENIEAYTAASRIAEVGGNFAHSAGNVDNPRLTAETQLFILDLILPEIACDMEKNVAFHYSKKNLRELIKTVLDGREDTDPLGIYGEDVFRIKNKNGAAIVPSKIADDIKKVFGANMNQIAESILDCAVYSLGIMAVSHEKGKTEYGFMHQHIRDYFAAVRHINAMRLAGALHADDEADPALEVMNRLFNEHPVGFQVRCFIGEALGEHYNKPYCDDDGWHENMPKCNLSSDYDRWLLTDTLDIYRGRKRDEGGYGVYSLVHLINEARGELSGINFSGIDFTRCSLNGIKLSRAVVPARFDNAVLSYRELEFCGHTSFIEAASFSPDGSRIVTASEDGTAKIWDADSLELLGTLEKHSFYRLLSAAFSPDGSRIVTASNDGAAKIWDARSFSPLGMLGYHSGNVNSAVFSPNGSRIVTASDDGTAKIWDAESFVLVGTLAGHSGEIKSAVFSPDGRRIATASNDGTTVIWDARSFSPLGTLKGHSEKVNSAVFSPDGRRIVTASNDGTAVIWDARSFSPLGTLKGHSGKVNSAVFSPDGSRIVTASSDGTAKIWDARSFSPLGTLKGHSRRVNSAVFSPDGSRIVTASDDGTAKIWDARSFSPLGMLEAHFTAVLSAVFSPDGCRIVTTSPDKTAKVWDTSSFTLLGTLKGHSGDVRSAAFSPDGCRIVTASDNGTAKIWDAENFVLFGTLAGHSGRVNSAVFSPDGRRIVTASNDGTAVIWDARSFSPLGTLKGHSGHVCSVAFSPDGCRIVTASSDGTAKIWDARSFSPLGTLEGHSGDVYSAVFSPDGSRIVTASDDGTAKIWDARSFSPLCTLEGDSYLVVSAVFSPDGCRIVTGCGTAKIWDARSFSLLNTLDEHSHWVYSAAFSSDGNRIVTTATNGTVKIWDATTFKCIKTIPDIPGFDFAGVDFSRLAPGCEFTDEQKKIVRMYGAEI